MIPLWESQQRAFEFGKNLKEVAYFCEPRTGKTYLTLAHIDHVLGLSDKFTGVLVTLLGNKESTWFAKLDELLPDLSYTTDWEVFKKLPTPRLFVVHYEALAGVIKKLCKYRHVNWMCVDEAHRLANRGTGISRACKRMSWVDRKMILTGTPLEDKPDDLFGQFRFLAPHLFGGNWDSFFNYWMDYERIDMEGIPVGGTRWQQRILKQRILQKKAEFNEDRRDELNSRLSPYAYHLEKSDVGIAKAKITQELVPMTPYQRRLDQAMKRDSLLWTKAGHRVMAELPVTKVMKRRQIASGFIYDDEGEVRQVSTNKLRILLRHFDRMPKPVIIFTAFRPDNLKIVNALRKRQYDVEPFHGGIPRKRRPELLRAFQAAELDALVCQSRTGGAGIDLWKSRHMIVHSLGHSSIDYEQLTSRADMANREAAEIIVLSSENSIDVDVFDLLLNKGLHGKKLMDALKQKDTNHGEKDRRSKRNQGSRA